MCKRACERVRVRKRKHARVCGSIVRFRFVSCARRARIAPHYGLKLYEIDAFNLQNSNLFPMKSEQYTATNFKKGKEAFGAFGAFGTLLLSVKEGMGTAD